MEETINYKKLQNSCLEVLLKKAASLKGMQLDFNYPHFVPDVQVDIQFLLLIAHGVDELDAIILDGSSETALRESVSKLDPSSLYLLRSGSNNGAGHFALFYFDSKQNNWLIHTSENVENNYMLYEQSSVDQKFSQKTLEALVLPKANWNKFSMQLSPLTENRIMLLANYVYRVRTEGVDVAERMINTELENPKLLDALLVMPASPLYSRGAASFFDQKSENATGNELMDETTSLVGSKASNMCCNIL